MKLSEFMSRNVQVVDPDCTLQEAAQTMKDLDVGGLPVCAGQKIEGFLTDRDIVVRGLAEGKDPTSCKVSEIMSPQISWCYEDDTAQNAGKLMRDKRIRRLLVMDRSKKLVGIVSLGDLAVESGEDTSPVLERISEHSEPSQPSA